MPRWETPKVPPHNEGGQEVPAGRAVPLACLHLLFTLRNSCFTSFRAHSSPRAVVLWLSNLRCGGAESPADLTHSDAGGGRAGI